MIVQRVRDSLLQRHRAAFGPDHSKGRFIKLGAHGGDIALIVEPSMSVNRKVTVPVGRLLISRLIRRRV